MHTHTTLNEFSENDLDIYAFTPMCGPHLLRKQFDRYSYYYTFVCSSSLHKTISIDIHTFTPLCAPHFCQRELMSCPY